MKNLSIVIPAFDRPGALARLLSSVAHAKYQGGVPPILVSIDGGAPESVVDIAMRFEWPARKNVVVHKEHKGLRNHILWCGDVSLECDGVILLEDDLVVSPSFYEYAQAVVDYYEGANDGDYLASYSLYSFHLNEFADLPFMPLNDGQDVYFVQTCSSWGQVWTARQWRSFRDWYALNQEAGVHVEDGVPAKIASWPETSWKKFFNKYMVASNRFSVVPRISLSTNCGDAGTHHHGDEKYQVPLLWRAKQWRFTPLGQSLSVYDAHFECLLPKLADEIGGVRSTEIVCDLYGTKDLCQEEKPWVLTSSPARKCLASFGNRLCPPILNVLFDLKGESFVLASKEDVLQGGNSRLALVKRETAFLNGADKVKLAFDACATKFKKMLAG